MFESIMSFPLSERIEAKCKPEPAFPPACSDVMDSLVSADGTFSVQALQKSDGVFTVRFSAWSRWGRHPNPDDHAWQQFYTESTVLTDYTEEAIAIGKAEAEAKGIIFE